MPGTAPHRLDRRSTAVSALVRMVENTGASARSASVFGDPVVSGGTTVVPVARVTALTLMGGGTGHLFPRSGGDGAGGTGFVRVRPAGFLVLDRDGTRFQAVRQPATMLAIPLAVVAAAAATRIVGVSVRGARRRRDRAARERARGEERSG
ncbi:GerW family sporulation protein [Nocardiopsis quinghaiensis]|uniref:GerW family sporulation protein n=1 Tax=Nocardiopsis quinghaiensis TaxID=464995 RepID=UPI00123C182F|nr:spore germination protein GerW family protein [Nocardiopsis quinghaiensis]